jgi:hypothetical protein
MIQFFNIKTGETRTLDPATMDPQFIEPAISALFNSGNLHVNATRGQDFGWRIAPSTVKRIRDLKQDQLAITRIAASMQILPENIADTDILTWIVKDDARIEALKNEQAEQDFSQQYEDELRGIGAAPREFNPAPPAAPQVGQADAIPSVPQEAVAEEADSDEGLAAQAASAARRNQKSPAEMQKEKEEEDRLMAELEAEEEEEKAAAAKAEKEAEAGSVGSPEKQEAAEQNAATSEAVTNPEKSSTKAPEKVAKTGAKTDNKSNS